MRRSRISKYKEKNNEKTIILSVLGITVVLFLLFKFGIGLLVNLSLFVTGKNLQNNQTDQNSVDYIAPPILNPLPVATNSAHIIISGKSAKNQTIHLYINGSDTDEVSTNSDGSFVFSEDLQNGNNEIKTKAQDKNKMSVFSDNQNVMFKNSPPSLDISSPSDGQTFKKDQNTTNVSGKTDSGDSVTVNGFFAVIDENNNFSYILPLQNGDNEIKIVATDQAGNQTEKDLKVNYSQ